MDLWFVLNEYSQDDGEVNLLMLTQPIRFGLALELLITLVYINAYDFKQANFHERFDLGDLIDLPADELCSLWPAQMCPLRLGNKVGLCGLRRKVLPQLLL